MLERVLQSLRFHCSVCGFISQIISKEARGITSSVSTVVLAPVRFLWYLLCTCGVEDEPLDDFDEDELGMDGVAEEED